VRLADKGLGFAQTGVPLCLFSPIALDHGLLLGRPFI
jgi:hypothetical protein